MKGITIPTERFIAWFIDLFIFSFLNVIVLSLYTQINPGVYDDMINIMKPFIIIPCIIFIFKDIVGGASIGKRFFNLYVGNQALPVQPVKKYKLIIRNLTYAIWPIEAILLILTGKRLGDRITKTTVYSKYDKKIYHVPYHNPLR